ncbi:hypothetical protein CUMW_260630 [Citrus unshiu]|uniref:K-box domain-containing protein n=1 Tax=Citrus unshiu TaxID=55188 RepID=A0A2H5QTM8_CITUN|nr:hypothetical protein CUMW_260630 [Citrus unshiu]
MKEPLQRTKVVIHHLPPSLSQNDLLALFHDHLDNGYNWFRVQPENSDVFEFAELLNGHVFVNEKDPDYLEFLKVIAKPAENLPSAEIQLERKEAQLSRSLSNWRTGLSEASRGSAEIEFLQKREVELANESVCLRSKIAEMERFQQANTATGQELNAMHELASRNFFGPAIIEGGGSAYSHPDKKILHLSSKHQRYSRAYEELKNPAVVFEFAELLNGHVLSLRLLLNMLHPNVFPSLVLERIVVKALFLKYYQQESAKLRQQIQMSQNSNRHLMGDSLSSLTLKELKQLENRLEQGITRIRSKKIAEMDRFQRANTVTGQELNAIHALASRNFFSPAIIEGGGTAYSHPDKKILHLG